MPSKDGVPMIKRKRSPVDLASWVQSHRKGCIICRNDAARDIISEIIKTQNKLHVKVRFASMADLLQEQLGERFTDNSVRDHIRRCVNGR
jgi:transcriptional regulator